MAIEFVGKVTGGASLDLTALTGGIDTEAREGDMVIVIASSASSSSSGGGTFPEFNVWADHVELGRQHGDDTFDNHSLLGYKVMGETPDAAVNITYSSSGDDAAIAYVLRGINVASPIEVAVQPANGADSGVPNPPSVSFTGETLIVAVGTKAFSATSYHGINAAPSTYDDFAVAGTDGGSSRTSAGIASKLTRVSPEDPGAFGVAGTAANQSWTAYTFGIAATVIPVVDTSTYTGRTPVSLAITGEVIDDAGETITRRGFVVSDVNIADPGNVDPDTLGVLVYDESGSFGLGAFELLADDLVPNTTYYYRAFAENIGGFDYGDEFTADTLEQKTPIIEAVTPSTIGLNEEVAITITGRNFYVGVTVEIDGETCDDIVIVDINTITCTAPSSSIQKSAVLLVENANGKRDTATFSYMGEIPPTPQPGSVTATFSVKGVSYLN